MILALEEIANESENECAEKKSSSQKTQLPDIQNDNIIIKTSGLVNNDVSNLKITHGPIIEDRKSVFQGHVCTVNSKSDVSNVMEILLQNKKIAHATHNISAYRILMPNNVVLQVLYWSKLFLVKKCFS